MNGRLPRPRRLGFSIRHGPSVSSFAPFPWFREELEVTLVQAPTRNQRLLLWVDEMVELCEPESRPLVRRLRLRVRAPGEAAGRHGHLHRPRPRQAARLLLGPLRPERRRPGRGPHLHLLRARDRRRPHQQLEGPRRDAGQAQRVVPGLHARPHHVRRALQHGSARFAAVVHRRRDHRLRLRGREHAHDDARRPGRARRARRRRRLRALRALGRRPARRPAKTTSPGRATPTRSGSCTSPRRARSGRSARATAATRCSARSASRCASRR